MHKKSILSVINFCYFTANFPDIKHIIYTLWKENEADHFYRKLMGIVHRSEIGYITIQSFMLFFFELSTHNQDLLIQYIDCNYHWSDEHARMNDEPLLPNKQFLFTLKHDSGNFKLIAHAPTYKKAIQFVLDTENCPERAILNIKLLK